MSGAIVVDGIERVVPAVRGLRQRILVLRQHPHEGWTINGVATPAIDIAAGERQFWRIVNASGDSFLDLAIDSTSWQVVALDGVALGAPRPRDHVLVPPAGRLEAIVTGPAVRAALRTRRVDTGPDGDPAPAAVLADLVPTGVAKGSRPSGPASAPSIAGAALEAARRPAEAVVRFSEDEHGGFYINGRLYDPADGPMFTVRVGSYAHWRVVNESREVHPFHIHQVHFLVMADSVWLDMVNVPPQGSVDVVLDATRPVIRGLSVFHCHMVRHEDKGMMAKVLFK
jgi:FtsP/CotA-like multicopper oxidase with cupredoxin domain